MDVVVCFKGFGSFWAERLTVAAGDPVHDEPPDVEHADVVVDVEKCDLVAVLPQNEEEGVHELHQLGEVVPPQDVYDLRESSGEADERASVCPIFASPGSPEKLRANCRPTERRACFYFMAADLQSRAHSSVSCRFRPGSVAARA